MFVSSFSINRFFINKFIWFLFRVKEAINLSLVTQLITFICSIVCFYEVLVCESPVTLNFCKWLSLDVYRKILNFFFLNFFFNYIYYLCILYNINMFENAKKNFFFFLNLLFLSLIFRSSFFEFWSRIFRRKIRFYDLIQIYYIFAFTKI